MKLDFKHQSVMPTELGDYVLFNQCDGYHIAEAMFEDDEFLEFRMHCRSVSADFYQAWAKMPDTNDLYDQFADKPVDGLSAQQVTLNRLAKQQGNQV